MASWVLWRLCVSKVCSRLAPWPCSGFLDALASLCSQGVFSACVMAWFWPLGRLGNLVLPRCVLCFCGGLVLASWVPLRLCVPKVCSLLAPWPGCGLLEALAALCCQGVFSACMVALFWLPGCSGGPVFQRCVLRLCCGLVLVSWEPWRPCVPKVCSLLGRLVFPRGLLCVCRGVVLES